MRAFRKALDMSHAQGKVITYTIVKDTPMFDVGDLFGRPDASKMTASATVCAIQEEMFAPDMDDKDDRDSKEVYEINGQVREVEPIKVVVEYDNGDEIPNWIGAPIRDVGYAADKQRRGSLSKNETPASISTTRSGSVTTQETVTLILQDQSEFEQDYLTDLQDEVEEEPWQKKLEAWGDQDSQDFWFYLEFSLVLIVAAYAAETGWCDWGTGMLVGTAFMTAAALITTWVIGEVLPLNDTEDASVSGLRVEDGYRVSDALSGTGSFSTNASFNVTQ